MGLSSKQVSGDRGIDWGQTLLQSGAAELSKPPSIRRQPPLQQQSEPLKCPRCGSTNTKFCYYNNYNKSQPRHFCKSCKRHWTKGGTLRNVPVGGGRKNKRPKISKATTTTTATATVAATAGPRQPDLLDFPLSANSGCQKSMSNILYQALISSSSSPLLHETTKAININSIPVKPFIGSSGVNTIDSTSLNVSSAPPQNPDTEFQFSSLSTFDMNASLNPTSYLSLNAFDHYTANLDSMEESTITTVNIPSSSSAPWPGPHTSSTLDLPSYWNWNDIDVLNSADLNISWDDDDDENAEIKP